VRILLRVLCCEFLHLCALPIELMVSRIFLPDLMVVSLILVKQYNSSASFRKLTLAVLGIIVHIILVLLPSTKGYSCAESRNSLDLLWLFCFQDKKRGRVRYTASLFE